MGETVETVLYRIGELPDPADPRHAQTAGGDVGSAVAMSAEHLARVVGDMPDSSVTVSIRFVYTPTPADGHPQSRLAVFLGVSADTVATMRAMRSVIESGPLAKFYRFEEENPDKGGAGKVEHENFGSVCRVYRRDAVVHPLTDLNTEILPLYYTCASFDPDESNDHMMLDRVLSGIDEPVLIDLAIRPTDAANELSAHTRYLARLQAINQPWGDADGATKLDLLEGENTRFSDRTKVEPLRRRDPMADEARRQQSDIQDGLRGPQVLFHILTMAESEPVARLVGSLLAESGFRKGSYQIHVTTNTESVARCCHNLSNLVVADYAAEPDLTRNVGQLAMPGLTRLPHIASVDELLGVWRLPLPASGSPFCIRKDTDPPAGSMKDLLVVGYDESGPTGDELKRSKSAGQGIQCIPRGILLKNMVKHLFTSGMPGSGKTTSNMNLLLLLHEAKVPFIVIETAKTEYRGLRMLKGAHDVGARDLANKLEIYTLGSEEVSPLRFNPLQLLPGISVDEHIDALLACFSAAMPLMGPLPALLGEGLERIYAQSKADATPLMSDLISAVRASLVAKKYSADVTSDIRAALDVRLGTLTRRSMGRIFQCPVSVPAVSHLLTTPTVIELDRLSSEHACLMTLFLLTAIREAVRGSPHRGDSPRVVLVIEEAHNVVGRRTDARPSEDAADPKAFAAEYVTRMLAELRALGVGIVVSDQLPSAVAPEVVKNTASKIAFRQVAEEDRQQIGATMLFSAIEEAEIARLGTGSAYLFTEDYFGPRRVRTINLRAKFDLTPPTDGELQESVREAKWWQDATRSRLEAELGHAESLLNECATVCSDLCSQAMALLVKYGTAIEHQEDDRPSLDVLEKSLQGVRDRIEITIRGFETGPLKRYVPRQVGASSTEAAMAGRVTSLEDRFTSIRQDAGEIMEQIGKALK